MTKLEARLFEVEVGEETHTIFEAPLSLPQPNDSLCEVAFNLVMVDVSGSMCSYWEAILKNWNEHLSPALAKEHTKLFVFGTAVHFRRTDNCLEQADFLRQSTNLTDAIATINAEIHSASESFVRLFLITDGCHNATQVDPAVEIEKLSIPAGKTVEVYLLGLDTGFPVEYSINIRSALHNGNSNVPSLFWGKCAEDVDPSVGYTENIHQSIEEQILSIADLVRKGNVKFQVSPRGQLAPAFPETETVHLGEYLYFTLPPSQISRTLSLSVEETVYTLDLTIEKIKPRYLLDKVFCQWNSLIIQRYRMKGDTASKTFEVMDSIYANLHKGMMANLQAVDTNTTSIKFRLAKKDLKHLEVEFATLMNQSKTIIGIEGQYSSEVELAEKILKTTVKSKYDTKTLKMKGHGLDSYAEDMAEFVKIFDSIKERVLALPEPELDDCCRVTMGSMLKDLQDPSLPALLREDKFTFLKTFTVTGIPIYAPVKASSQINPWALVIKTILRSPFSLVSHNTLELSAEVGGTATEEDKEVFLLEGDETSRFNAVVPVFTPQVAAVLKPLIRSNVFAMLSTFCVLKNAHIIDHNAHIAALGCTWIKMVTDFPLPTRPQFAADRILSIETTAQLFVGRGMIAKYIQVLHSSPSQALMTESTELFDEKTIKCESLIKPMFFFYLDRDNSKDEVVQLVSLLLLELVGRCLSSSSQDSCADCVYSHFFVPQLSSTEKRDAFFTDKVEKTCREILDSFIATKGKLNDKFFTLEDLRKTLDLFCEEEASHRKDTHFDLAVNARVVTGLKNSGSAGDIRVESVKMFAREMGLSQQQIEQIFDDKKLFTCVYHSLQHKTSRERLAQALPTYDEAYQKVTKLVCSENDNRFKRLVKAKVKALAEDLWRREFLRIHESEVVTPMARACVMKRALERGVSVDEDNFDKVFRHKSESGLLRNACMVRGCAFFLTPSRSFNQHIAVEREEKGFPHQLHKVSLSIWCVGGSADDVISRLVTGPYPALNGLRAPPAPPMEKVVHLKGDIGALIKGYGALRGQ